MQERMDRGCYGEQRTDRPLHEHRPLGILLRRNLVLLKRVPPEKGLAALVLLTGPIERGLEHPEVVMNRVRPDRPCRRSTEPPPHDVLMDAVRWQRTDHSLRPE